MLAQRKILQCFGRVHLIAMFLQCQKTQYNKSDRVPVECTESLVHTFGRPYRCHSVCNLNVH